MSQHWLFKTEPETYSFETLKKEKKTNWNGVRNFQARNFLNQVKAGDLVLIYHSGKERAVVGVAKVTKAAYPDPDPKKKGDWVQLDLSYSSSLKIPVALEQLKKTAALKSLLLIKQSRLSCMPVSEKEFKTILDMST